MPPIRRVIRPETALFTTRPDCWICGASTRPVWAGFPVEAENWFARAHGSVLLPMHACPDGHLTAWRPIDIAEESNDFLDHDLFLSDMSWSPSGPPGATPCPPPARPVPWWRFWRRLPDPVRCPRCGHELELEATGRDWHCALDAPIEAVELQAHGDLSLPIMACRSCG